MERSEGFVPKITIEDVLRGYGHDEGLSLPIGEMKQAERDPKLDKAREMLNVIRDYLEGVSLLREKSPDTMQKSEKALRLLLNTQWSSYQEHGPTTPRGWEIDHHEDFLTREFLERLGKGSVNIIDGFTIEILDLIERKFYARRIVGKDLGLESLNARAYCLLGLAGEILGEVGTNRLVTKAIGLNGNERDLMLVAALCSGRKKITLNQSNFLRIAKPFSMQREEGEYRETLAVDSYAERMRVFKGLGILFETQKRIYPVMIRTINSFPVNETSRQLWLSFEREMFPPQSPPRS